MVFLKTSLKWNVAVLLFCGLVASCASTLSGSVSQPAAAVERDSLAKVFERIAKGPLQPDEATSYFLVAEQLYFERNVEAAAKVFAAVFEVSPSLVCGMRLSELYLAQGKGSEAERVVNKLAVLFPQSAEAPLAQARVLYSQGKNNEAVSVLKRAYETYADNQEIAENYVDLLLRMGKRFEAAAFLENAVVDSAAKPYMLQKLAEIRIQDKKYVQAKALIERLLRAAPEDVEAWTLAGFLAVEENDFKSAEKYFREAHLKQPENDTLTRYYVTQLLRLEKYQEARRLLLRLEASADAAKPLEPELIFQLALVLFKLDDFAAARSRFLNLAQQGDDSGKSLFYAAQCDEMLKNSSGAMETYQKIASDSSFRRQAVQRMIYLHIEAGEFAKAKILVATLDVTKDSDEQDFQFLSAVYARMKEHKKAIEIATQGLAKYPKSAELATLSATWLEFTKSREAAVKATEAVLLKFPKHASAHNYLAYTLAENGERLDAALSHAQMAVQIEPKNGFYLDTLGWVLFKRHSFSESELQLTRALAIEPDEPVILEHLGELALAKNQFSQAIKHFEGAEAKFSAQPEWKVLADKEWAESRGRVNARIQELRRRALSK